MIKLLLAAYISVIVAFAVAYAYLPGHFYHSTIRYEPAYWQEVRSLRRNLEAACGDTMLTYQGVVRGRHSRIPGRVWVDNLGVAPDGRLAFTLTAGVYEEVPPMTIGGTPISASRVYENVAFDVRLDVDGLIPNEVFRNKLKQAPPWQSVRLTASQSSGPTLEWSAMRSLFARTPIWIDDPAMVSLSPELAEQIAEYRWASGGVPSGFRGTFWRMLYFSATTINTVGFGDIVPLTGLSRFLVAAESLLGIVLLGTVAGLAATRAVRRSSRD
jgi:Ion channel